jgi:hypothetical protein
MHARVSLCTASLLRNDKDKMMQTNTSVFDALQTMFQDDLHELHRLQKRGWLVLPMTRIVKEEHLGRCCYLAEEFLDSADLCTFKNLIGVDERCWQAYKARVSAQ